MKDWQLKAMRRLGGRDKTMFFFLFLSLGVFNDLKPFVNGRLKFGEFFFVRAQLVSSTSKSCFFRGNDLV